jgi:hypothetical protein
MTRKQKQNLQALFDEIDQLVGIEDKQPEEGETDIETDSDSDDDNYVEDQKPGISSIIEIVEPEVPEVSIDDYSDLASMEKLIPLLEQSNHSFKHVQHGG